MSTSDQIEQDAAAFRYMLAHPMSGVTIIEEVYAELKGSNSREIDAAIRARFCALVTKAARPSYRKGSKA